MAELPFQAEYAKSGRASCKGCKGKIEQGSLRLAAMIQVIAFIRFGFVMIILRYNLIL